MRALVTGAAGFIGFHTARRLLEEGNDVIGVDGMTSYYDPELKRRRQEILRSYDRYQAFEFMLEEGSRYADLHSDLQPEIVVHLAAQAGVRYSLENPRAYVDANLIGTFNVLEACRKKPVRHLLLASTSSAYGGNTRVPFRETDPAVLPLTLYAASKLATEHMAHSYSHLFGVPTTAFRFFTVYGPWGRPDMALFLFVWHILRNEPIEVFNDGASQRDFTFIDDLVEAISRLIGCIPIRDPTSAENSVPGDTLSPVAPFRLVNIGGGHPVSLLEFIAEIERATGRNAEKLFKPLPPGDIARTEASADLLLALTGYRPDTPISTGVPAFVSWYRQFYDC
ncbi:NAD-dependent epimerase/dehydratase family protein [Mesorhizobium sp. BAC0120]|uniref:NAD-dependent epimerase/dehydratase family protein n=1 Tax=Mesorhizobium sp. BAC0120 TaxID=3090670 RepID=UPI00298C2F32|nr:NAD-dependent epimerase/dehydratase family protein [Mesorhizobium sp. BAC0120]MDW6023086.1 NAD-dependent epimerase/dehydratase family protein [Mesorhizobium sp. BAC0120]